MKKFITILSIILFIIAFSCATIWFAPYILNINIIKQKILTKVEHKLNAKVNIGYIKWIWLPFSHIELIDTTYRQKSLKIDIPNIIIYPDISEIFLGKVTISKIVFIQPNIEIFNLNFKSKNKSTSIRFPAKNISIKNATIIWHSDFKNIKRTFYFRKFNLKAKLDNTLYLNLNCLPPEAEFLSLKAKLNINKHNYSGNFKIINLKAHKIFLPYISRQTIMPIKAILNINGIFSGNSTKVFNAAIKGQLPCLVLKRQNNYLNISCGNIDLDIHKHNKILNIIVNKINLINPKMALAGKINIYKFSKYSINVIGKNIDLTTIRKQLITLWGKQKVVETICNIVRGGTAEIASFRFFGDINDLKNINKLHINAKISNGQIYIPYGHLNLTNISGNLKIEDGILIAQNISAKLKDNYATKGTLLLGLHGDLNDLFHLELNLNSNLSQLKNILPRVIPNQQFNHELSLFSNITGRAIGSLYLGESLKHIKYRIIIKKAKASFIYKRLYWPIQINDINLFIDNYIIKWSNLNTMFGSEHIFNSSGSITLNPIPWINIYQCNAFIKIDNILKYLKHYPLILSKLHKIITNITGNISIKDLKLNGPIKHPSNWLYTIDILSNSCKFSSPKLPGLLSIKKCNFILNNNKLDILELVGKDNNTPININGYLMWENTTRLSGSLTISGILNRAITNWLKEKNWIPIDYFPSFPLNIKKLFIHWDYNNNVKLNGHFVKVIDSNNRINISLNLKTSKNKLELNNLKIQNTKLSQLLSLSLIINRDTKSIKLTWDGCLDNRTLNSILLQNNLLHGQIKGSYFISYNKKLNSYKFLGTLTGNKIIWKWGTSIPLYLEYLSISGNNSTVTINNLSIKFPDKNKLELAGMLSFLNSTIKLHLICSSNYLTSKTLELLNSSLTSDNNDNNANKLKISGNLSFYINRYKYFSKDKKYFIFKELTGKVYFLNSKDIRIYIEHTWLCNLAISGCIYPKTYCCKSKICNLDINNHKKLCYLWIRTIKGRKNNFNDILTCLNIKQDMISGNLNINIKLLGNPKCWHKGTIHIWSTKGRIYKLAVLAKILSIINFTDLITEGVPKLNKKGFGYSKLDIKGKIINNKLKLQQAYVKGEGLNIFATGWINIKDWNADLTVLVSPFKTIDIVLKYIPIVGEIIGGKNRTFITIPIGIKGPINNPKVKPLPISAIGKGLLGIVKRTLGLPVIVIKSIKDL